MIILNQREFLVRRRLLRQRSTLTEELLWSRLRRDQLGIKFRRQYGIGPYIADFYAPRARLAVEIDGSIHDSQKDSDEIREKEIEGLGIRFLRFTDQEILGNIENVLDQIRISIQTSLS